MKKPQNCNSWEWLADKLWTFTPRDLTGIAIWHPYLLHPASNKSICPVSCKADWFLWESASSLFNQPTNLTFCWLICVGCCMIFLPLIKSTSKFQLYTCENNTVRLHKRQDEILTQTMELFLVQIIQNNPRNKLHQVWSPMKCHCHSYIWTKKLVSHNQNLVHLYPKLNSIFPTRFSYTPQKRARSIYFIPQRTCLIWVSFHQGHPLGTMKQQKHKAQGFGHQSYSGDRSGFLGI